MSRLEHEIAGCNHANDLLDLRKQLAVTRGAHERAVLFRVTDLILRVERGHPHDSSPPARDLRHVLDRRGVHAADGQVQVDAAEYLDARHFLPDNRGQAAGRVVVVLEDDPAHAVHAGELRSVDRVNGSWRVVGVSVNMDIDRAGQQRVFATRLGRSGPRCASRDREGRQRKGHQQSDGPQNAASRIAHRACGSYWVRLLTASPTLNPVPETTAPTADPSSTSVILITPTGAVMRRMTLPLAGSLISRDTRSTFI